MSRGKKNKAAIDRARQRANQKTRDLVKLKTNNKPNLEIDISNKQPRKRKILANYHSYSSLIGIPFNGEKTWGELGNAYDFFLDYQTIRKRTWEAYIKTDIIQNVVKKYVLWIIGEGLKLQAEPIPELIGLTPEQTKAYVKSVETNFRLFAEIEESSYSNNESLHAIAAEALTNAVMAGDVLCVSRFIDGKATMQIIDGGHIKNPIYSSQFFTQATKRGNKIIEGIEFNKRGERIAFYVMQEDFTSQRILAKHQKTGRKQAWLFLGLKYKLDSKRGLSLLAVLLETAAKIDRYKDATITAAEDLANVPFTFEHESYSDGEDPNDALIAQSSGTERVQQMQDSYADCEALAPKVALSTKRRVYNLPVGASLKKTQQGTDINFEKFFGVNSGVLYTTFGMPPEIATDKFGGSYSASRAALMAWQYKMMVDRMILLNRQFYSPFYNFWLDFQIITGKIEVDGYFEALISGDFMKLAAFRKARFTGKTVDHIDPLKEAKALRTLLGDKYANVPLKTVEQAMEFINSGEFNTNIEKSKNEQEIIDNAGFGIEPEPTKSE